MTTTDFRPDWDLDDWVTKDQLEQRIHYCWDQSNKKDQVPTGDGAWKEVPGEWSAQFAARHLYLEGVLENWDYLEKDEQGRSEVDEMDYVGMLDSLCEDQGLPDVYENGPESLYSWMVWAKEQEVSDFASALVEWMEEQGLPAPEWSKDPESIWFSYFHEDED